MENNIYEIVISRIEDIYSEVIEEAP